MAEERKQVYLNIKRHNELSDFVKLRGLKINFTVDKAVEEFLIKHRRDK
jgi:hypothetical protein